MISDHLLFMASLLQHADLKAADQLALCTQLQKLAPMVRTMEVQLDSIVASAQDEDALLRSRMKVIPMRPWKLSKPKLRVVAGGAA